ncbi:MAG: site-specific integrase, partial [Bacteroidales bacterium]
MATLTYFIRTSKKGKKAKIRARLRHNEDYLYAKTNYSIEPENWDKRRQRIKQGRSHSVRDTINNSLSSLETIILDLWNIQNDKSLLDSEWLQHKVDMYFKTKSQESKESQEVTLIGFVKKFIENIDEYVDRKTGKKLAERTKQKHKRTFDVLKDFVNAKYSGVLLKDINYQFYGDFLKYLTNKKDYAVNTVGKYISSLKVFLNQAKRIGIFIDLDGFTKLSEVSDSVYLNENELLQIYEYDFSGNKRLERVRDLFIVGCWTGLRFGDLTSLTKDIIKEDKI